MGVPCAGCGREYDVTLFGFGRTIWCTCGRRVGAEPRVRRLGDPGAPRFIADAMLGRLARWLRLWGFDCEHDPGIADAELVRRGVLEERVILTRDRALPEAWWVSGIELLRGESLEDQLGQVARRFDLAGSMRLLTRCSDCNRRLERVDADRVRGRVPTGILETRDAFSACPGCGRVYWEGTHTERIRRVADRVLGAARPTQAP